MKKHKLGFGVRHLEMINPFSKCPHVHGKVFFNKLDGKYHWLSKAEIEKMLG